MIGIYQVSNTRCIHLCDDVHRQGWFTHPSSQGDAILKMCVHDGTRLYPPVFNAGIHYVLHALSCSKLLFSCTTIRFLLKNQRRFEFWVLCVVCCVLCVVGYSVVRTCVCDDAHNRIAVFYGYGWYIYMRCSNWMVMRPIRRISNERYGIVRSTLCSRLLYVRVIKYY